MKTILTIFLLCILNYCSAQNYFEYFNKFFSGYETIETSVSIGDNHYGMIRGVCKGGVGYEFGIVKVSATGQRIGSYTFDGYCEKEGILPSAISVWQEKVISCGKIGGADGNDLLISEFNEDLILQKDKILSIGPDLHPNKIIFDKIGNGYLLCRKSQNNGEKFILAIFKLDRQYNPIQYEVLNWRGPLAEDFSSSGPLTMAWTDDGNLSITTRLSLPNDPDTNFFIFGMILNPNLKPIQHIHQDILQIDTLNRVPSSRYETFRILDNKNLLVSQQEILNRDSINEELVPAIYKTDLSGLMLWKAIIPNDQTRNVVSVKEHPTNRNVYVSGQTFNDVDSIRVTFHGFFLACYDPTGDFLWMRKYWSGGIFDRSYLTSLTDMEFTDDGGILLSGEIDPNQGPWSLGWLFKLDEYGCSYPGCGDEDIWVNVDDVGDVVSILLFPNPTQSEISIKSESMSPNWTYQLYNFSGGLITTDFCSLEVTKINIPTPGVFLVQILNEDGGLVGVKKVVRE